MIKDIKKITEPLYNRIILSIARAVIHAVIDDNKRQVLQLTVLKGEVKENVERVQNYGLTSVPLPGAEGVVLCLGGNRDHPVVVALDDPRHRLIGLEPGEVALYSHTGDYIILKTGNEIELSTSTFTVKAGTEVRMETPQLKVTGTITDLCDTSGLSMSDMRQTYNGHTHVENNVGSTNPPTQPMGS